MVAKQIQVDYDPDGDVLYISFDPPKDADAEEIEPGVWLRRDPDTKEIVGVTVVNYSKREKTSLPVQIVGELQVR